MKELLAAIKRYGNFRARNDGVYVDRELRKRKKAEWTRVVNAVEAALAPPARGYLVGAAITRASPEHMQELGQHLIVLGGRILRGDLTYRDGGLTLGVENQIDHGLGLRAAANLGVSGMSIDGNIRFDVPIREARVTPITDERLDRAKRAFRESCEKTGKSTKRDLDTPLKAAWEELTR